MAEESKTTSIIDDLPESQEADPTAKDLAFVTASWGRVIVGSKSYAYDVRISPGRGVEEWNWRECGTHHDPGITVRALAEDDGLRSSSSLYILSTGFHSVLRATRECRDRLTARGIPYLVLDTKSAVEEYNKCLVQGKHVALLLHCRC